VDKPKKSMNPLHSLDQEALLDALTEYYQKYRRIIENNWNRNDYDLYRDTLMAILKELETRREPSELSREAVTP
jgi:DNA-directed RNA polymerase specialized sigma24 family protein